MNTAECAVLFDLDGTLVDTAGDLVGALWAVCDHFDHPRPPLSAASRAIGDGGAGLIRHAFGRGFVHHDEALKRLIEHYHTHIADVSRPYEPLGQWLQTLDDRGLPWGVVTNKKELLARRLLSAIDIRPTRGCIVGGDTLTVAKPDPAPLYHAAGLLGMTPRDCIYCGDHKLDIDAGNAAGMHTIAVGYGYITDDDSPMHWGADDIAETPLALAQTLDTHLRPRGAAAC